jgi:hypothetical protein
MISEEIIWMPEHVGYNAMIPSIEKREAEEPLAHWIEAQRFALGAALLRTEPNPTSDHLDNVFSPLKVFADLDDDGNTRTYANYLKTLPLMTLQAMCNLDPALLGEWQRHHSMWQRARDSLVWEESEQLSPLSGAKLLANRILTGEFTAAQLIRIAALELNRNWATVPGIQDCLDRLVAALGAHPNDTHGRPSKLRDFKRRLASHSDMEPGRWALVENCILHQSYYWPLVLLDTGRPIVGCSDQRRPAFAMPIEPHISLAGTGQVTVYPEDRSFIIHDDWKASAMRSLRAAKMLWQHSHSSWNDAYHRIVEDAAIVLDLRMTEQVVEPYKASGWISTLHLKDSSLDVYLALIILSHFLGVEEAMETICATGTLTEALVDRVGGDHRVTRPDGVEAKLELAEAIGLYDTFITAKSTAAPLIHRTSLRVCETFNQRELLRKGRVRAMFSDFAAEALNDSLRHRYIRCPDVAHAFRNPQDRPEVDQLFDLIRSNTQTILTLDQPVKATTVARALYRVNDAVQRDAEGQKKVGNFAFIRAVSREDNERFWRVLWHLLQGSSDSFKAFRFAVDTGTPTRLLAEELNRFAPDTEDTHDNRGILRRAPDVLVIIGSNRLSRPNSITPNSPFERLSLDSIVDGLSELLHPSPTPDMTARIGSTRVILVPENDVDAELIPAESIDADIREHVQRLSIFRNGFRFHTAQHMLPPRRLQGWDLNQLLDYLLELDHGSEKLLLYSDRTGEYFFNRRIEPPKDRDELATLHSDAANAIAGIFRRDDQVLRSRFREALSPAWLHETEWHLGNAKTLPSAPQARNRASHEHERISRIGEPFGWSTVRWAASRSNETDDDVLVALRMYLDSIGLRRGDTVDRLTDIKSIEGDIVDPLTNVHPIELVWAARLVSELARRVRTSETERGKYEEYIGERDDYFDWATRACVHFDHDLQGNPRLEGNACRFAIATSRACLLVSEEPGPSGLSAARGFFLDAAALVNRDPRVMECIIDFEWFEILGDREVDHRSSVSKYQDGIVNDYARLSLTGVANSRKPPLFTVVKYLGAAHLADMEPHPVIADYAANRPNASVQYVLKNRRGSGLHSPESRARWEAGARRLVELNEMRRADQMDANEAA